MDGVYVKFLGERIHCQEIITVKTVFASPLKRDLLLKERICWEQIFSFRVDPKGSKFFSFRVDPKRSWPQWLSWMRRPSGDQEVAGSTPAEVGSILSWRLTMKCFLRSFSPFR